ncbi:MAG: hypothetical protein IKN12_07550 [Selenomonadaceae bacterium]|nr:hypothetical protein [Selenomonadaceae bacterium]
MFDGVHISVPWLVFIAAVFALFAFEMVHSLKRSHTTARLISTYLTDLNNETLFDEIFNFCQNDYKLRRILKKHNATKDDIKALHKKLMVWGNIKKGRRFPPISSFFYAYTLDYLFTHRDDDDKKVAMRMLNFFHI